VRGPSTTARLVAAARLRSARAPAPGGRPDDDDRLAADVAGDLVDRPTRLQQRLAARTAFVDRTLLACLDDGVGQVVVAAAGYDGRPLRYARNGVRWFEVDHPDTQTDKRERLARLGIRTDAVTFVPADFRTDPVAARLTAAGCDPDQRSVVLCEGLAVYLEDAVLERLLRELGHATGPGSLLALTVSPSSPRAPAVRARFDAAVAAMGEPALSHLSAADAAPLLDRAGWQPSGGGDPAAGFVLAGRR
jgi:methyltransferase (TIGR00027 family)